MDKTVRGPAYVVGDSVDTDQIIPAEHLVYSMTEPDERRLYGCYAMSAVPPAGQGLPTGNTPFADCDADREGLPSRFKVIVAGGNFGCGSSREHAPFAISEAGCRVVVAESFARIFFRNAVDGGFLVPIESPQRLIDRIRTGDDVEVDVDSATLTNHTTEETFLLKPLGEVAEIVRAGSVFEYARQKGLIPS
ncbi:MAG: 3-isopropylmalate dehydratase [Bacteroidetes bacterium]|nr:3-isopropylmalate dehydratase [Bacteroidota bacterium]